MSAKLRLTLGVGLAFALLGCASAGPGAGAGAGAGASSAAEKEAVGRALLKQTQEIRTVGGLTRIDRWRMPGEELPRVIKGVYYTSGLFLTKGIRMIYHREQQRWMLSLDEQLHPLDAFAASKPYPALPQGFQGPVIWQGAFEHGGYPWLVAVFKMSVPKEIPGIATEEEISMDFLLWRPVDALESACVTALLPCADFQQLSRPALLPYRGLWGERLPTRGALCAANASVS